MPERSSFDWWLKAMRQYADVSGRARRREYWWFTAVQISFALGLMTLAGIVSQISDVLGGVVVMTYGVFGLATFIPGIAVAVRRLHDTGRSGWMMLLSIIPLANLYLLYLMVLDGEAGENAYGPDPKWEGDDGYVGPYEPSNEDTPGRYAERFGP